MKKQITRCMIVLLVCYVCVESLHNRVNAVNSDSETEVSTQELVPTGFMALDYGLRIVIDQSMLLRLYGSWKVDQGICFGPGVICQDSSFVHGAHSIDNLFQVDGISQKDRVTGENNISLSPEVLDTLSITTSSHKAEHGGFMGGLYQVKTLSGTNEWHASARLDFVDTAWNDESKNQYYDDSDYDFIRPTLTLRGPILRDRLWFLGSYSFFTIDNQVSTIPAYGDNYGKTLVPIDNDIDYVLPFLKVSTRPLDNHRIDFTWFNFGKKENNAHGDPFYSTPVAWTDHEESETSWSLNWNWKVSSSMQVHLTAGKYCLEEKMTPKKRSDDPRDAPFTDSYWGQKYNNSDEWWEDTRESMQISGEVTWLKDNMWGDHRLKTGIEYEARNGSMMTRIPGGATYDLSMLYNSDDFSVWEAWRSVMLFPGTTERSGDTIALFVQDDWSITNLITLYLGVRYERAEFKNDSGDTDVPAWRWGQFEAETYINDDGTYKATAPMCFDDMIAPRIGFNWDIFGSQKTVVRAFYGRYYNPFDLSLPGMFQPFSADQTATREETYVGPEWSDVNHDGVPDEEFFFDDANWEEVKRDLPGDWNLIDPNLKAEYTDEFMVGIDQEIMPGLIVGLTYNHRESNDMIEDIGLFMDEDYNVVWTYRGGVNDDFTGLDPDEERDPIAPSSKWEGEYDTHRYYITNVPGNKREYDGFEISASARQENWDLEASYTWSEAKGSVIEGNEDYVGIYQFSGQYDTWGTAQNLFGELPWSCRHFVKLSGSYRFDLTDWYEISIGVNAFWRSGYHYSKRGKPPKIYDPNDPAQDPSDEDTWSNPPYRSYNWSFLEPRGQHELSSDTNIDCSFQNTFKLGRYGAFKIILDVKNLTDDQKNYSPTETYYPQQQNLLGDDPPRSYRLTLKYSF